MRPLPPLDANAPLLLGTVRSLGNDENSDGDIVLTKVNVNGVDRVKIFQREHQNGLKKLLFRAYDSMVGNVNCTKHLEDIEAAARQQGSQPVTHQKLTSTLKNIRLRLEQSETPRADKVDLVKTLESLQLIEGASKSSDVELGEPQWSPDDLVGMLMEAARNNVRKVDEGSLAWLADLRSDPNRVFTHHEKVRIGKLVDEALKLWIAYTKENYELPNEIKQIWLGHTKKNNLPEEGDISKIVRRELLRLKDHATRRCTAKVQEDFYMTVIRLLEKKKETRQFSANHLDVLCKALGQPDQPLELANNQSLCKALAYLHSQWDALKENKDVLFELKPLLLEAKRVYAREMKDPNNAMALNASTLKPPMLDRMVEDIRLLLPTAA